MFIEQRSQRRTHSPNRCRCEGNVDQALQRRDPADDPKLHHDFAPFYYKATPAIIAQQNEIYAPFIRTGGYERFFHKLPTILQPSSKGIALAKRAENAGADGWHSLMPILLPISARTGTIKLAFSPLASCSGK